MSAVSLPEWRCTRPRAYPPFTPPDGRDGHYIRAATALDAATALRRRYPTDPIDVQAWKLADNTPVADRTTVQRFYEYTTWT